MLVFTLFYKIHDIHYKKYFLNAVESFLYMILHQESLILESRSLNKWGQSKKVQGRTALKSGGGSLAVGRYLQRGSEQNKSRKWYMKK